MMGEWQSMPFERLLREPVRNGIYKPKEFHGRGAKIVNMGELFANPRLRAVPMKRVELSDSEKQRFTLSKGDLIFARRSLVAEGAGKCSVVLDIDELTTFESSIIRARPDPAKADPLYLYYFFSSSLGFHRLDTIRRHVAVAGITGSDLAQLEIPVPPLPEQRAIAHILGTLDDKIELNRRMNETLEAMARALFKSWFVDFDPVRAKAERRDPGLPKPLANLFPDSFEDSELGEIPKGWRLAEIGDIADVIDCLHAKKPDRCDVGRPFLQLNNIRDDGLIDMTDTYFINEADYQKWISRMEATKGDCVITNVGRVGAVAQIPDGVKAALGRNMTGIRCKQAYPYPTFLIECLLSDAMRQEITRKMDSGTILNALNVRNIPKLRFVQPDDKIMTRFEQAVRPLRQKMEQNLRESRILAALRDTLLPKLIAGEVRVNAMTKRYSHG